MLGKLAEVPDFGVRRLDDGEDLEVAAVRERTLLSVTSCSRSVYSELEFDVAES